MNISSSLIRLCLALSLISLLISCKEDDDPTPTPPQNDEEVITSVFLTFTDKANFLPVQVFAFRDPDGDGGNGPTQFDTIQLVNGNIYEVRIELLDESGTEVDTITAEIEQEADEHLFCFTPSGADLTIVRTDSDGTFEIGLTSDWTANSMSSGTVRIEIKTSARWRKGWNLCSRGHRYSNRLAYKP